MAWLVDRDGTCLNVRYVTKLRLQNNGPEWLVWADLINGEVFLLGRHGSEEAAREAMQRTLEGLGDG